MNRHLSLIIVLFLLISCDSIVEPIDMVTQGGQFIYTSTETDEQLERNVISICEKRNCSSIQSQYKFSDISFNIELNTTQNDQISVLKFKNNLIDVTFFQKKLQTPSIKTILVLSDLRDQGFSLKFIGGEKWHCDGKPLKRRYCTQENIPENNQDFLEYILQENHMDLDEIKRHNEYLLSQ